MGAGDSIIIWRMQVNPSMTGMSISSTITSGLSSLTFSRPSSPFLATPTTLRSGSDSRISVTAFLMNAESSTTSTFILLAIPSPK